MASNVIPIHARKGGGRFAVGHVFIGRYTLLQRLGHGGMGEVWAVMDEKTSLLRALKVLSPDALSAPGARDR